MVSYSERSSSRSNKASLGCRQWKMFHLGQPSRFFTPNHDMPWISCDFSREGQLRYTLLIPNSDCKKPGIFTLCKPQTYLQIQYLWHSPALTSWWKMACSQYRRVRHHPLMFKEPAKPCGRKNWRGKQIKTKKRTRRDLMTFIFSWTTWEISPEADCVPVK